MYELLAVTVKGADAEPFDKVNLPDGEEVPMPTVELPKTVRMFVELALTWNARSFAVVPAILTYAP